MPTESTSKSVDLQQLLSGAAKLELKALSAGVEYWQTWMSQATKLSTIANDTLRALEDNKASLSETARRLAEFGKDNTEVFASLSQRLGQAYFVELARLAESTADDAKPTTKAAADDAKGTTKVTADDAKGTIKVTPKVQPAAKTSKRK